MKPFSAKIHSWFLRKIQSSLRGINKGAWSHSQKHPHWKLQTRQQNVCLTRKVNRNLNSFNSMKQAQRYNDPAALSWEQVWDQIKVTHTEFLTGEFLPVPKERQVPPSHTPIPSWIAQAEIHYTDIHLLVKNNRDDRNQGPTATGSQIRLFIIMRLDHLIL